MPLRKIHAGRIASGPHAIPRSRAGVAWKRGNIKSLLTGNVRIVGDYFLSAGGSRTASMMWMTPFEHFTSAVVTLEAFR